MILAAHGCKIERDRVLKSHSLSQKALYRNQGGIAAKIAEIV